MDRKRARLLALAGVIVFSSTIAVLLARQFNFGPVRPAPAFRTFGAADAPIQIFEYTDFACPACRHAAGIIENMRRVYGDALRLSFKHYPLLNIHPWSLHAAAYADCAGAQGRFGEYGALLFEGQEKWAPARADGPEPKEFEEYAKQLGLDWEKMRACAEDQGTLKTLKLDIAEGDLKGVNATPTFFVNGRRAVGAGQLLDLAKDFDNILKRTGKK